MSIQKMHVVVTGCKGMYTAVIERPDGTTFLVDYDDFDWLRDTFGDNEGYWVVDIY